MCIYIYIYIYIYRDIERETAHTGNIPLVKWIIRQRKRKRGGGKSIEHIVYIIYSFIVDTGNIHLVEWITQADKTQKGEG